MKRAPQEFGFSLLELMVALTMASVLAVAAFTVFFNSQRATGHVTRVIENRQNSRTAIQLIERDLRMAGSGWGNINVDGSWNGAPLTVTSIQPGYGGSDNACDSLGLIGGWDASTSLRAPMAATSADIRCVNTAGFANNDLCVVTNGETAHLFQITGITAPPYDLAHATTSNYNGAGGHNNWPPGGYKVGAKVYRVSWVSYQVDSTSARHPQLVRWQQNALRQVVANDVCQFRVLYLLQDDLLVRNPDDVSTIARIHPVLTMQTPNGKLAAYTDSSWATVKPRSM